MHPKQNRSSRVMSQLVDVQELVKAPIGDTEADKIYKRRERVRMGDRWQN